VIVYVNRFAAVPTDPNLLFLMKNDGTNIYDGSPYHSTITLSTTTYPVVSNTTAKWGTHSTKLDWDGVNLCYFTAPNAGLLAMSQTEGITIESWVYIGTPQSYYTGLFGIDGTAEFIELGFQGTDRYLYGDTATSDVSFRTYPFYHNPGTGEAFPPSGWKHFAVVRPQGASTTPRVYFDGSYVGVFSDTWTPENGVQNYARIGMPRGSATDYGIAYLEDFRIMKGELYTGTGTYTIPTATFQEY
jgi:Concanavalin A-like lectin/glucanases superfamily